MRINKSLAMLAICLLSVGSILFSTYSKKAVTQNTNTPNPSLNVSDALTWQQFLVDIREVIPNIPLDIRYFTAYNFIGRRIDGYNAPRCLLTPQAAKALKNIQNELISKGYSLKIYDCYRPQQAVDLFVLWAKDLDDTKAQSIFYPNVDKSNLFTEGYIAEKSGHSRGSTLDLTIVPLGSKPQRNCKLDRPCNDNSIDMGTPFDFFDPLSNTANPNITKKQKQNRLFLKSLMEKYGFKNLPEEWWHFTFNNEPYPDTFFNFPIDAYPRKFQ